MPTDVTTHDRQWYCRQARLYDYRRHAVTGTVMTALSTDYRMSQRGYSPHSLTQYWTTTVSGDRRSRKLRPVIPRKTDDRHAQLDQCSPGS